MIPSCVVLTYIHSAAGSISLLYSLGTFHELPCKYVKLHFSDGVNDLSKAHYFFTKVERVTKHIVTREIRAI